MRRIAFCVLLSLFGFSLCGCVQRLVDFTIISTRNVEWSRAAEFERSSKRVTGEHIEHIILIFPTGIPNMENAIEDAIDKVPGGVALIDGVLRQKSWYIPFLYGQSGYLVDGTVLIDPKIAAKKPSP